MMTLMSEKQQTTVCPEYFIALLHSPIITQLAVCDTRVGATRKESDHHFPASSHIYQMHVACGAKEDYAALQYLIQHYGYNIGYIQYNQRTSFPLHLKCPVFSQKNLFYVWLLDLRGDSHSVLKRQFIKKKGEKRCNLLTLVQFWNTKGDIQEHQSLHLVCTVKVNGDCRGQEQLEH